jgi:chloride channel protein, CIC family
MDGVPLAAGTVSGEHEPAPSRAAYLGLGLGAAVLGAVTAVGVWLFNQAFDLIHRVVFDGVADAVAPLGGWTLIPILGAGGVVVWLIVRLIRPEPLGAVPHIIDGILERDGQLNDRNAAVTVAGSAVGIGFGMPLGADTPSAMIGGHLGSIAAIRLGWPTTFVRALVVAGVAAGISSTFLAQLAAIVFALEVVLGGFGGIVFVVPTLIAVGVAGFVSYELTGTPAQYPVPLPAIHWDATLLLYLIPAVLGGLAAIAYVGLLQRMKPAWARVPVPPVGRLVLAGGLVGLVAIWLPQVMGTGTATMKDLFGGATIPLGTLLALAIAETILTPSSLGAGFVGGVIGPSMLIGSTLGAAVGTVVIQLFPDLGLSPVVFAMVGTAAMLAGSFHAPVFGALMIFEMAGSYEMLVPLVLAAAIGYALARPFQPGSAYTLALHGRGIYLAAGTFRRRAEDESRTAADRH